MGDSTLLGISEGLGGGASHLLLILLFPVGLLTMVFLDARFQAHSKMNLGYLAALAVGFHGVAEGIAIGSGLSPSSDVFAAIGGVTVAESFVMHKALEGFAISVFLVAQGIRAKTITTVLVAGFPTTLGALIGFVFSPDSSYFFALGGGAALWLLTVLIQRSLSLTNRTVWAIALLLGFFLLYSAGLLHSV
jgi:zinc transporter ZupT